MILHTVNKSPHTHSALRDCAATANAGDLLLLLENGVYAVLPGTEAASLLQQLYENNVKICAIEADVAARGLSNDLLPLVQLVDYGGFVSLTTRYTAIQSWY